MTETADKFCFNGDRRADVAILFERWYRNGTRWGGDLHFCNKWRATGGKVHAVYEMCLGHTARSVIKGSLGSGLRRQSGTTLRYVADMVRSGSNDIELLSEARRHLNNPWGAQEDVLSLAILMARKADGPIIETGSGLSTVLMAAATDQMVYCLEHDPGWAAQLKIIAGQARVSNIALCMQPLSDGWYDLSDIELPKSFALGLNDGPPRALGSRMGFFERFDCDVIVADDAHEPGYAKAIETWAGENGRKVDFVEPRAALIRKRARNVRAA